MAPVGSNFILSTFPIPRILQFATTPLSAFRLVGPSLLNLTMEMEAAHPSEASVFRYKTARFYNT
jgi:hypothetical protein